MDQNDNPAPNFSSNQNKNPQDEIPLKIDF